MSATHAQSKERMKRERIVERLRGRDKERVSPTPTGGSSRGGIVVSSGVTASDGKERLDLNTSLLSGI